MGATSATSASFFVGQSIHFVNGIVFGLWFALVVYNQIPTFFPKTKSIQKGLLFAIVQTIISTGFLFPYVYAPKSGFGALQLRRQRVRHQPRSLEVAVRNPAVAPDLGSDPRISVRSEAA